MTRHACKVSNMTWRVHFFILLIQKYYWINITFHKYLCFKVTNWCIHAHYWNTVRNVRQRFLVFSPAVYCWFLKAETHNWKTVLRPSLQILHWHTKALMLSMREGSFLPCFNMCSHRERSDVLSGNCIWKNLCSCDLWENTQPTGANFLHHEALRIDGQQVGFRMFVCVRACVCVCVCVCMCLSVWGSTSKLSALADSVLAMIHRWSMHIYVVIKKKKKETWHPEQHSVD